MQGLVDFINSFYDNAIIPFGQALAASNGSDENGITQSVHAVLLFFGLVFQVICGQGRHAVVSSQGSCRCRSSGQEESTGSKLDQARHASIARLLESRIDLSSRGQAIPRSIKGAP